MNRREFLGTSIATGAGTQVCAGDDRPARFDDVTTTGFDFPVLGRIEPREARAIVGSSWSVGGETLDRDYTAYEGDKEYLGPLGAKAIRLQAGWAKCERAKVDYAWGWLDAIVDVAVALGRSRGQARRDWSVSDRGGRRLASIAFPGCRW